jgi:hypothetical protein
MQEGKMPKDNREEEERKPKFKIVDRRGTDDEPESPEPVADAKREEHVTPPKETASPKVTGGVEPSNDAGKTEMTEEEKEALQREVEKSFKFPNSVIFILRTISEQVLMHIGLIPNPVSRLTVKNMEEARKFIDLYEAVLTHTEGEFDEKTLRELKRLQSDLKVNYTNQLGA